MDNVLNKLSRRQLLKQVALWPFLSLFFSFFSCKKNSQATDKPLEGMDPKKDNLALDESVKNIRSALKYVDKSPIPIRTCDNCKLFIKPLQNSSYGGCQVIPGPIVPKGYCISWVHLM